MDDLDPDALDAKVDAERAHFVAGTLVLEELPLPKIQDALTLVFDLVDASLRQAESPLRRFASSPRRE